MSGASAPHFLRRSHLVGVEAAEGEGPEGVVGEGGAAPRRHQVASVHLRRLAGPVLLALPLRRHTGRRSVRLASALALLRRSDRKLTSRLIMTTTPTRCSQIICQKSPVLDVSGA